MKASRQRVSIDIRRLEENETRGVIRDNNGN